MFLGPQLERITMRAALLTLLALAVTVRAADGDKEYYPMKIGTTWTYKVNGKTDKFVVTAVKSEKVGEQDCVKFEAKLNDQLVGSEHVAILKDGLYRFKFNDDAIEPAICFFKASGKKGDSWQQDFKVGGAKATGKYMLDEGDVEVPAGKYPGSLIIKADAIEGEMTTKTTIWFAKNVGMVKQEISMGEVKITLELEKMDEPKK